MPSFAPTATPGTGRRHLAAAAALAVVATLGLPSASDAASHRGLRLTARPAPVASPATPRIVGGTATTIAAAPYQVRIRAREDGNAWGTQSPGGFGFSSCGGAILNARQIVTAAHCTFGADPPRAATSPILAQSYVVDSGFSRFDATAGSVSNPKPQPGDTPQSVRVASVRRHPGYVPSADGTGTLLSLADDVAVLTLSTPLKFDANTAPVALPDPGQSPVGTARITGFGLQSDGGTPNGGLYLLDTPLIDAATSEDSGGAGALNALYVVSRSPSGSTCQGDSGGPLVQNGRVVGVVSSGPSCGPNAPSYYTNLAAPEILAFVQGSDTPPAAPRGGQDVVMTAKSRTPRTGDALVCNPGTWSNGPTFSFSFVDTRNGRVLQSGASGTYVLRQADLGATVACRVIATTPGGAGRTPQTTSTPGIGQGPRARFSTRVTAASKARRRSSLAVRLVIRNAGDAPAHGIVTCVRPGRGISVVSRGGGRLDRGQLCWTNSSLNRVMSKRFGLQVTRRARIGRRTLASVSVAAADAPAVHATRRITVGR